MVQSINLQASDFQQQVDGAVPFDTGNTATSAGGAAATVTIPADAARPNVISQVFWSYSAAPTGGGLTIQDVSGTTVFTLDITASGPGSVTFTPALCNAAKNSALIVTLLAPGGAVVGKLNVNARKHT